MPPRLTVAIPTFNRHGFLRATLAGLRAQARDGVELVVVDNCSEPPVEEMVREVLGGSGWAFRVVRNPINVGLCANILRCFEVASGDWLWVLSDDDTVKPDAVSTICQTIDTHPDLVFTTYSVPPLTISEDRICRSAEEFGANINSLGIVFISSSIYRRSRCLSLFSRAHNYIGSGAPHTALLFLLFLENPSAHCAFLASEIVGWKPASSEHRYSKFFPIALFQLLDICTGSVHRRFARSVSVACPTVFQLLIHLIRDASRGRPLWEVRAHWKTYMLHDSDISSAFLAGIVSPLRSMLFHLCLLNPKVSKSILDHLCKLLKGRAPNYDPHDVSFNTFRRLNEGLKSAASVESRN